MKRRRTTMLTRHQLRPTKMKSLSAFAHVFQLHPTATLIIDQLATTRNQAVTYFSA